MDTRYRIYTEDKPNLQELVGAEFESFTMFLAEGVWRGESENSAVIEILGHAGDRPKVLQVAERIRVTNDQTAVLVTSEPVRSVTLTATHNPDVSEGAL